MKSEKYRSDKRVKWWRIVLPLLFTFHFSFLTTSCGGGDDDGRRLGEVIVGTWQRGWGEGDVVIEGDTDLRPENFAYDQFVFNDDGSYNGMVREGTFIAYDTYGNVIFEGKYQCDNHNMRLEPDGEGKMLAQVVYFTDDTLQLRYENEQYNVTVTFIVRKL
ncbi:MAG: hypothetical protein IKH35_09575 [Prevotella sp.]|nr:hypothetical protein [Prevotella sp.]